jgi:Glyoxalase/Bleomycin resistance protein/Dioxygenase superfamily.
MLTGLNHITLAVSNVSASFTFYVETLGFTPRAQWKNGAYLSIGELWLCLSLDAVSIGKDYTHYALSIEDEVFEAFAERLKASGVKDGRSTKVRANHSISSIRTATSWNSMPVIWKADYAPVWHNRMRT